MPRKQLTTLNILITATILFAWGHSMMPGDLSEEESGRALELLRPFLEIFVGKGNVTEHLIRKLAHFSEYALLGCELCLRQLLLRAATQTAPASGVSAAAARTSSTPAAAITPAITTPSATAATRVIAATSAGPALSAAAATPVGPIPLWIQQSLRILVPCLAVCFIDETIQLFVPGRAGLIGDMWIDMAGAVTGLLIGLFCGAVIRKVTGRRHREPKHIHSSAGVGTNQKK